VSGHIPCFTVVDHLLLVLQNDPAMNETKDSPTRPRVRIVDGIQFERLMELGVGNVPARAAPQLAVVGAVSRQAYTAHQGVMHEPMSRLPE
jgi:hypothetical protein